VKTEHDGYSLVPTSIRRFNWS